MGTLFLDFCFRFGFLLFVAWISGDWMTSDLLDSLQVGPLVTSLTFGAAGCLCLFLTGVACTWAAEVCSSWCGLCLSSGNPLELGAGPSNRAVISWDGVAMRSVPENRMQGGGSSIGRQVIHLFCLLSNRSPLGLRAGSKGMACNILGHHGTWEGSLKTESREVWAGGTLRFWLVWPTTEWPISDFLMNVGLTLLQRTGGRKAGSNK